MSVLSDFFIADAAPVPRYKGGDEFEDADKVQFNRLTPVEAGQLLAVLRGQGKVEDMVLEFKLLTPEDAEEWTMSVPQDMVNALARVQFSEIPALAARFADATAEELGWSADDFVPIVGDLSALARRAVEKGKRMYLWNSL